MIKLLYCLVFCVFAMRRSLQSNIDKWKSIGASDTVINWINEAVKFPLLGEVNSFEFSNGKFSAKEIKFLETEINSLLLQGWFKHIYFKSVYTIQYNFQSYKH